MKNNLKLHLMKGLNQTRAWLAPGLAVFTMAAAPVAMGQEVKNLNKARLQAVISEMGLNRQITFGEFYNKNKDVLPPRIQNQVEPFIARFKNQPMPQFEVTSAKGTDGAEVPNLQVSRNGELINIQFFGEKDKFAKFQNTTLTMGDIHNFSDMFNRIAGTNDKFRKQVPVGPAVTSSQSLKAVAAKTMGYPEVSAATWKKMSLQTRAAYVFHMRQIWSDSLRVLSEVEKRQPKAKKTASLEAETFQKWESFLALINQAAVAAGTTPTVTSRDGSSAFVSGSNCIVAGYVSTYTSKKCDVTSRFKNYPKEEGVDGSGKKNVANEIIYQANEECLTRPDAGPSYIACNPIIYGTPGGKAACIDTSKPSFQEATHANGPCEQQSSLGPNVDFLIKKDQNGNRYKAENIKVELESFYREQQGKDEGLVKSFLDGLVAYNKKNKAITFKEPFAQGDYETIKGIKDAFDNDIKKARESCELAAANKNNEKNFWGACDQLHRRYLNVAQFLQKSPGCPDGDKKIDPESLKCKCGTGESVLPGNSCKQSTTPPATASQCPAGMSPETYNGNDTVCMCSNGAPGTIPLAEAITRGKTEPIEKICPPSQTQPPKPPGQTGPKCDAIPTEGCICESTGKPATSDAVSTVDGRATYKCDSATPGKPPKPAEDCGFLCKTWKFAKDYGLWIAGAIGLGFAFYKLLPKKPKLNAAADICPSTGVVGLCPTVCGTGKVILTSGACGCANECPSGTTISSVCECVTGTATTTTEMCWDGVTPKSAGCPEQTVLCPDGVTRAPSQINCPETPAAGVSSKTTK